MIEANSRGSIEAKINNVFVTLGARCAQVELTIFASKTTQVLMKGNLRTYRKQSGKYSNNGIDKHGTNKKERSNITTEHYFISRTVNNINDHELNLTHGLTSTAKPRISSTLLIMLNSHQWLQTENVVYSTLSKTPNQHDQTELV